ncbi:MAG: BON domain-containing protein, partial [Chloroflexi bacterium]|nr:BON domain-containing protein [Chloroflexota bacterium]
MSFLTNLVGTNYKDDQLASQAMKALATDPLISDASTLLVTSKHGVITLGGIVPKAQEKEQIEGVVRSALTTTGLKHERLVN